MKRIYTACLVGICVFGLELHGASGQSVMTAPVGEFRAIPLDSGVQSNSSDETLSVWRGRVKVDGAAWLRLYFSEITLGPGSTLVITSLHDQAMQHHTARTVADWSFTSAYFNGSEVEIELIAGPHVRGDRVVLSQVAYQVPSGSVAGELCGVCNGDNRVVSDERWVGRMMPIGCTGSIFSPDGCFVTAGHCLDPAFIMQFQVPLSLPDGTPQNPGPEDQYPILQASMQGENCCPGVDWGFFQCGANTETNLTPIEAQGEFRPIAISMPDEFPVEIEITGYGVSLTGQLSQAQKHGVGQLLNIAPFPGFPELSWFHNVDTTGGNSGSALLRNNRIIGIATHCTVGCPNLGMVISYPPFVDAWSTCQPTGGDCDNDGDIDLLDFAGYAGCLTGPVGGGIPGECDCLDIAQDSRIDLADHAGFQNIFTGNFCLAPDLVTQPQDQIICSGLSAALSVAAQSNHSHSYQWFKNGVEMAGETGATIDFTPFQPSDAGTYTVRVSNICGTAMTTPAILTACTDSVFADNFENNLGWTVVNDPQMDRGQWFRSAPAQTLNNGIVVQPGNDNPLGTGTRCFGTGPFSGLADANDVDGGPTVLTSPAIDTTGLSTLSLRYAFWYFRNNTSGDDALMVSVSRDSGATWTEVVRHETSASQWRYYGVNLHDLITPTNTLHVRFSIQDIGDETLLEALVDDVEVVTGD